MSIRTVDKITKLARSLFAERGYEATAMNDIAEGVGIKKPAIYTYFAGKDELFLAVFRQLAQEYREKMDTLWDRVRGKSVQERLSAMFAGYIRVFAGQPESSMLWNRVLLYPPAHLKEQLWAELLETERPFAERLRQTLADGVNEGIIKADGLHELELSFRSLREGLLMAYLINPELDAAKIERVWHHFWNGIGGQAAKQEGEV
ncbi:TetR/AcrR family transcriptional regulator [Brevibacillus thermoruber]|jgi:AcrR family transcriptional regulator|uniref:TetR/AcrR family transcriptional regulator n=1 Tax=Brevibacillus thermoruber TaxID=33942 RepID=A0A9X3TQC8_9BACL|nr:TetR/AcrR family transcriptional regulator [Brevibacillus thermoruber]MDA5108555.1 TetR/AcrR family transcriptional regulator [Brevibacillus thermoruber]